MLPLKGPKLISNHSHLLIIAVRLLDFFNLVVYRHFEFLSSYYFTIIRSSFQSLCTSFWIFIWTENIFIYGLFRIQLWDFMSLTIHNSDYESWHKAATINSASMYLLYCRKRANTTSALDKQLMRLLYIQKIAFTPFLYANNKVCKYIHTYL